jgi:protein TonB
VEPTLDRIPAQAQIIDDPPLETGPSTGDGGFTVIGGTGGGGVGQLLTAVLKPPLPTSRPVETARPAQVKPAVEAPRMIRVSDLHLARLIHKVDPVFPQLAKQARVQGTVQVEAIIAVDGHMRDVRAVSGHPLLIPAAIEAVRQWIYEPTVLNGERVEVSAPITVNFKLSN